MHILFDTDIGDDIDDSFALALLLKQKRHKLIGVTTVYRDTAKRAAIAAKIINAAGYNVPVYAGCVKPYLQLADIGAVPIQYGEECSEFLDAYSKENIDEEEAVDFIIDQAKKLGNQLTIVTGGALTNIAKALARDYSAISGVGKIIITGGCFFHHHKEWNICCDVEAAKRVLESDLDNIMIVNWDVTKNNVLEEDHFRFIKETKPKRAGGYLSGFFQRWYTDWKCQPVLHAATAIMYTLMPELLEPRDIIIKVETVGHCRGLTLNCDWLDFRDEAKKNAVKRTAAVKADSKKIADSFMKTVYNYKTKN